ncbi:Epoxyqueuosine reductase [Candidatus Zixiibacteriota bacterium]|nr:Epoxyqueuosine reductase [candidate division Zixibacteria bacterium]
MTDDSQNCDAVLNYETIKNLAHELQCDSFGIARAEAVAAKDRFTTWLEKGYAGDMDYLSRNLELRLDPQRLLPGAQSIIVIGLNYYPQPEDEEKRCAPYRVARYAWGEDYHDVLRRKLKVLRNRLRGLAPALKGRICVDTAPFMDKYWAARAGLGWQGKHTNLVSRAFGSWLLLGSLIINAKVDRYDSPGADHCGQCHACLEACPTGALLAPYQLDATRCISFWTIESKGIEIPSTVASKLNDWIFGCDICIAACPFNKFQKVQHHPEFHRREEISELETGRAAKLTSEEFENKYHRSPVTRPGLRGIVRNYKAAGLKKKRVTARVTLYKNSE